MIKKYFMVYTSYTTYTMLYRLLGHVWLKLGIGANSGPAVFVDSFLSVFMGMVLFASFFCIFILHVELCMRQVVPFLYKMGIGSCFYFGKHA